MIDDGWIDAAKELKIDNTSNQLKGSFRAGLKFNPDEYAKAASISAKTGVSPNAILENPTAYKTAEMDIDPQKIAVLSPKTASWLVDNFDNVAMAYDDLDSLLEMEKKFSSAKLAGLDAGQREAVLRERYRIVSYNKSRNEFGSATASLAKPIWSVPLELGKTLAGFFGAVGGSASEIMRPLVSSQSLNQAVYNIKQLWENPYQEGTLQGAIGKVPEAVGGHMLKDQKQGVSRYLTDPKTGKTFQNPDWETISGQGMVANFINPVLTRDTANTALGTPAIMAMALFKPDLAAKAFAGNAAREKYIQAQVEGADPRTAALEGMVSGLLNYGMMTKLPTSAPPQSVSGLVGNALGRTAVLGTGMTMGENLATRLHNPNQDILEGLSSNLVNLLGFEVAPLVIHIPQVMENRRVIDQMAAPSKLRDRAPEKRAEVIAKMVEGTGHENTLIDAQIFMQTAREHGIDPEKLAQALGAKNLPEALAAGTDLVIPTERYDAQIAGNPELHKAFAPDLKFKPGQWSQRQMDSWTTEARAKAEADIKAQASGEAKIDPLPDGLKQIQDRLTEHLVNDGHYERSTAEDTSAINARMVYSLVKGEGLDPVQYFDKLVLTISRPLRGESKSSMVDMILNRLIEKRGNDTLPSADQEPFDLGFWQGPIDRIKQDLELRGIKPTDPEARQIVESEIGKTYSQPGFNIQGSGDYANYRERIGMSFGSKEWNDYYLNKARHGRANSELTMRAREANRKALTKKGEQVNLDIRSEQAKTDAADFAKFDSEVKALQVGDVFPEGNRGFIQFAPDKSIHIGLLEKMDLTTFFHEFGGHFGLELMKDLATREGASDRIKSQWNETLKFLGAEDGNNLTRDQHEKYARAFEAYLLEGKAPSEALRPVFARVKEWFKLFYRQVKNLGVQLNPGIRKVFDQMLASDTEIEQARKTLGDDRPLFTTAEEMGKTQAEFDLLAKAQKKAIDTAKDALQERIFKDMKKQQAEAWKTEKESIKEALQTEIEKEPAYQAFQALVDGKLEDGTPIKLNKADLEKSFGKDIGKELPRKFQRLYTLKGGLDPDSAAEILGFDSGHQLIKALREMEPLKDRVEREASAEMVRRHGDITVDGTLADAAVEAIHNQARADVKYQEAKALKDLARKVKPFTDVKDQAAKDQARAENFWARGVIRELPPRSFFVEKAREIVRGMSIKDLDQNRYMVASEKHSREAFEAFGKKDYSKAYDSKYNDLMNHNLYVEALRVKDGVERIEKYVKNGEKTSFQSMLGLAGKAYQDNWNDFAERYEFTKVSNKSLAAASSAFNFDKALNPNSKQSLADFIREQNANEEAIVIDPRLVENAGRRVNYREATISELEAVHDAMRNIETVARAQVEFDQNGKKIAFDDAVKEIDAVARANNKSKMVPRSNTDFTLAEKAKRWLLGTDAYMGKIEWSIDKLDGGDINGPARRFIKKPIDDAAGREKALGKEVYDKIYSAVAERTPAERAADNDSIGVRFPKMDRDMTKGQLISWVLNLGTEENRRVAFLGEALVAGDGSLRPEVDAALRKLTASDCKFIQSVWDALESMRPLIVEKEMRTTGVEPKWKTRTPFTVETADGQKIEMQGGYYPLKADREISDIGQKQVDLTLGKQWNSKPTTSRSHTKDVTGATYPLLLDYQTVLGEHLPAVIKDVTMGEAISQVGKILAHPEVMKTIGETLGPGHEAEFKPWLEAVAGQTKQESNNPLLRFIMSRRSGMVAARLAGNLSSYLVQGGDSTKLIPDPSFKLGLPGMDRGELLQAHYDIRKNPKEMIQWIRELSPNEMAFREEHFQRDIKEILDTKTGLDQNVNALTKWLLQGFQVMDRLQSFPAWLAQFRQGMKEHGNQSQAVMEADRLIARAFQAGEARNMSRMLREPGLMKLFTTFGGDANTWYGILSSSIHSKSVKRVSVALMALVFEQMLAQTLRGRTPQKGKKEEWVTDQAFSALFNPFGFFGDLADYGVKKIQGKYAQVSSPTMQAFEKIFGAGSAVRGYKTGTKDVEDIGISAFDAIGTWAGLPGTGQVIKTWKYTHGVRKGDIRPKNTLDIAKGIAFGPPPKETRK